MEHDVPTRRPAGGAPGGAAGGGDASAFDVEAVRRDFPILATAMNGHPLAYLDNAATTQKPRAVIDALSGYYERDNANIHRGVYALSQRATAHFDAARVKVADFLGVKDPAEVVFVRGVTEAINLVAASWGRRHLKPGDGVVLTALEHHSNIVPWQMAAAVTGAVVRTIPMRVGGDDGTLDADRLDDAIGPGTKIVAVQHVSNALGVVHDVAAIVARAKAVGARVLIDAAQAVGHFPTDVNALGCDWLCFSGHKLFGPTGVGVLWGRREVLEAMDPHHGGGDMIETVTWQGSTYAPIPARFEAGTPDIAGVIGLGAAVDYVRSVGFDTIVRQERGLLDYATTRLKGVPGLRIIGDAPTDHKAAVVSFVLEKPAVSALDVGTRLDALGIAVRTGHHCAQPLMDAMGVSGTIRASFAFYNTRVEVDRLADALHEIVSEAAGRAGRSSPSDEQWPEPQAASPDEAAALLLADVAFLREAGEDVRDHFLDLGRRLVPMRDADKNEATHVKGCMSQVWLHARRRPGTNDAIDFVADSDAELVRGLIAVLQHVFSGQSARAILTFDVARLLRDLDFGSLISVQRRSGVEAMINRIQAIARASAKE